MGLLEAIIIGIIQGITEFIPVSSSGHILLAERAFGHDMGAGFTAVIQIGTLIALLVYFRQNLAKAFMGWARSITNVEERKTTDARIGWAIFFGTIPIAVIGLALEDHIDTTFRAPELTAYMLLGVSALMLASEWLGKKVKERGDITIFAGIVIGFFQAIALVPGASRSGSTIAGGMLLGFNRTAAAEFSFLLSVPSIALSGIYKLVAERDILLNEGLMPTVVATLVSLVSGYLAIAFLMNFLKKHGLYVFIFYRVLLAIAILTVLQGLFG